jgi:hypothetical protein
MENAELWQLGGDRNAPTSWSMRQMCWECRTKVEKVESDPQRATPTTDSTSTPLSESIIADVNEAARALEHDAV